MKKIDVVQTIIGNKRRFIKEETEAFAPANIALCKYWGKRNTELNLPATSSLSISLGDFGTHTRLRPNTSGHHKVLFNGAPIEPDSSFYTRLEDYLNLFCGNPKQHLNIDIKSKVPLGAGLASSASGFASLVLALNQLCSWNLKEKELSILARLGSGSACRSIEPGFAEWKKGTRDDGMDSYAQSLTNTWFAICVGLLVLSPKEKQISSREAMLRTLETSPFYPLWPKKVEEDLRSIKQAIDNQDFKLFGQTAESNALAMHATMLSSWPPISYYLPETIEAMQKIWKLREEGLEVYFTQDAGPNLKLLFLKNDRQTLKGQFPDLQIYEPF